MSDTRPPLRPVFIAPVTMGDLKPWTHRSNRNTRLKAGLHHVAENMAIITDGRAFKSSIGDKGTIDVAVHFNPLGGERSDHHVADLLIPASSTLEARKLGVDAVSAQLAVVRAEVNKAMHGIAGESYSLLPASAWRQQSRLRAGGIALISLDHFQRTHPARYEEIHQEIKRRRLTMSHDRLVLAVAEPRYLHIGARRLFGAASPGGFQDRVNGVVYHAVDLQHGLSENGRRAYLRTLRNIVDENRRLAAFQDG